MRTHQGVLCQSQQYREHANGVDGFHHELKSQYLQRCYQQNGIDNKIRKVDGDACSVVDDGSDTGDTSCHDLVR